MSGVGFNNHNLLAQSYDKNKDGFVNELQVSDQVKAKVDTDRDGNISTKELASALKSDSVAVKNGQIVEGRPLSVNINGLETLRSINSVSSNARATVYERSIYDLKGQAKVEALFDNNRQYAGAIRQMESGLRSIRDISRQSNDGISRSVNITAKNALEDSRNIQIWSLVNDVLDNRPYAGSFSPKSDPFSNGGGNGGNSIKNDPFSGGGSKPSGGNNIKNDPFSGGPSHPSGGNNIHNDPFSGGGNNVPVAPSEPDIDTSPLERKRSDLRATYEILNNALSTINEQTSNLPDVQQTVRGVDNSISNAFSNINVVKSSKESPTEVKKKLYTLADMEAGQVKGRGKTYGGIGAGAGLVAGGVTGYLVGKNAKAAAIGAGAGLAVAGAIGALVGSSIDNKHKQASGELKTLGDQVEKYNPEADEDALKTQSQNTYNKIVSSVDKHDIDSAVVTVNDLNAIKQQVNSVEARTANIAKGYKIAQNGHK
ncbi:MAG: hypothetical protein U0457_20980 [Candidatus Sericytochromatia bacterium]